MAKEYIARNDALEIVKRTSGDYVAAFSMIKKLPSANMNEVKHGEWKPVERLWEYSHQWQCTKCGNPVLTDRYLYCPYCGAKMDGKER